MAIAPEQLQKFKSQLDMSAKPLFFFDDDPDGLCSFLLMYRHKHEGKGIIIKSSPEVRVSYLKTVHDHAPDTLFILDKPKVSQDFADGARVPIFWLDHHTPQRIDHTTYFNPRIADDSDNSPTSYWAYQIVQNEEDLWLAMVGSVSDWFTPLDLYEPFKKRYPKLLPKTTKKPDELLFSTPLGELCRIFSFILKGQTKEVLNCIKILTRIKDPSEIFEQTTTQGKYIYKRFQYVNQEYTELITQAKAANKRGKILFFNYTEKNMSFTTDLSNELLYLFPNKLIIIARKKGGEMKCSLRSAKHVLPPMIEKSLMGLQGYGGGHDHACGACIKEEDFDEFMKRLKEQI